MVFDICQRTGVLMLIIACFINCEDPTHKEKLKNGEINTESNRREEALALIAPYSNWDQFLMPAPMVIELLGQLMIISADKDFTLENKSPKGGFKYLKYPNSFRTSLVQISNVGWEAFNQAHVNMDQIRLHSVNIDSYITDLMDVLIHGGREEMNSLVPLLIRKIQRAADSCLELSTDVEKKFVEFMQVTGELLEASTSAKVTYEDKLKEAEIAIKVAKNEGQIALEEKERMENDFQKVAEDIEIAQKQLKEVLESSPSVLKIGAYRILDASLSILRVILFVSFPKTHSFDYEEFTTSKNNNEGKSDGQVFMHAFNINTNIQNLVSALKSGNDTEEMQGNWDMKTIQIANMTLGSVLGSIERVTKNSDVKQTASNLCRNGMKICEQCMNIGKTLQDEENTESIRNIIREAEKLLEQSKEFYKEAALFLHTTDENSQSFSKKSNTFQSDNLVEGEYEMYRLRIKVAKEVLEDAKKRQENINIKAKENNDRLQRTIEKIAHRLKESRLRHSKTHSDRRTSRNRGFEKTVGETGKIFPNDFKYRKSGHERVNSKFVDTVELGTGQKIDRGDITDLIRDLMYRHAFKANSLVFFVRIISGTYVEVSNEYLMDGISILGGLMALDPNEDEQKIKEEKKKLSDNSRAALDYLKGKKEEKEKDYFEKVDKRLQQYKLLISISDSNERVIDNKEQRKNTNSKLTDKTEL